MSDRVRQRSELDQAVERLDGLLRGRVPEPIDTSVLGGSEWELATRLNRLFVLWQEILATILPLSRGELDKVASETKGNHLLSPFKDLRASLLHLTWQTKQVAAGDYSQRVDFMGDFSEAFNSMVIALDTKQKALEDKIEQLEQALVRIATLEDILPICSGCSKVRIEGLPENPQESWVELEQYVSMKTSARFSHGLCPDCLAHALSGIAPPQEER